MTSLCIDLMKFDIPSLERIVLTHTGDGVVVDPGQGGDTSGMGAVNLDALGLLLEVPHKDELIEAGGGNVVAVGVPGNCGDGGIVEGSPGLGLDGKVVGHIPNDNVAHLAAL